MPLYQYRCSCGESFESLESFSAVRQTCADACVRADGDPQRGTGDVERVLAGAAIRGDGREAKQVVIDPCAKSNRPGGGCH
jgi:predicted nucleic acid-binding Zn ribbon protein